MNLNHALIVGELAGNTNFALVLLYAPVQTIYVCICAWIDKEPAVEEKCAVLGTLCNVKMEKSGGGRELCFPWTRVSPLSSRPPSLLAVARCATNSRVKRDHLLSLFLSLENEIPFPSFRPFARVTSALRLAHGTRSFINERVYFERKTDGGRMRRTRVSGLRMVKRTVSTPCDA